MLWPSLHPGYMACNPYENISQDMNVFGENADSKQAITDIALEYGMVTNYTSMVVVREEVFESLGIQRNNNQRVQTEQAAQQQRAQQPVVTQRVDTQQPMYSSSRARFGGGGGGALDGWMLLLLLPLFMSAMQQRKSRVK